MIETSRNKVWEYVWDKKLMLLFHVMLIPLVLLPQGYRGYYDVSGNDVWTAEYIFDHELYLIISAPLFLLGPLLLILKPSKVRDAFMYILIGCAITNSGLALLRVGMLNQDFAPGYGSLIALTFGPIMLVHLVLEDRRKKMERESAGS